jgi:hypothetical protein
MGDWGQTFSSLSGCSLSSLHGSLIRCWSACRRVEEGVDQASLRGRAGRHTMFFGRAGRILNKRGQAAGLTRGPAVPKPLSRHVVWQIVLLSMRGLGSGGLVELAGDPETME